MEKPIQFYTPLENSATGNAILLIQKKVGNKLFVVPTMDTNISIFKANIFERSNEQMKQVAYISKVRYLFSPFTYYVTLPKTEIIYPKNVGALVGMNFT